MENQISTNIGRWPSIIKEVAIRRGDPLLGLSAPGIGKSAGILQATREWAAETGRQFWSWDTPMPAEVDKHFGFCETIWSQHDPTDIKFPALKDGEFVQAYSSELPLEGNEKRFVPEGVWSMDEITKTEPYMAKCLMQILLERRIGSRRVLPGWRMVGAGNRIQDRSHDQILMPTIASRFTILNLESNLDDWVMWAHRSGIHPLVIAFLRYHPQLLHQFDYTKFCAGEFAFPCQRQWASVSPYVELEDVSLRTLIVAGKVGSAAAGQFEAYNRTWQALPDLDEIERTGDGKVPSERDGGGILIAVVTALVHRASAKNISNVFKYVGKLPNEFQTLFAKDLVRKDMAFAIHESYNAWCSRQKV